MSIQRFTIGGFSLNVYAPPRAGQEPARGDACIRDAGEPESTKTIMTGPYDNHEHRVLELRRDLANLSDTEGHTHEHLLWDLIRVRAGNYSVTNDEVARWVHAGMDLQKRLHQEKAGPRA